MYEQKRSPWLAVILGVGCVGILCIGVLLVGGGAVFFLNERTEAPIMPEPTIAVVIASPTSLPPTLSSAPTPASSPTDSGPKLTGDQILTEHSLYDDFSSDALGWPVYEDGKTIIKYEQGNYSIQIAELEYVDWAYFPVDFIPYEIWFDVQGLPGDQDGTFGVFCQYQDVDNYYYAEFDLEMKSYILAYYRDGEETALTKQNTVGQFWYETSALKSYPTDINRIGLTCYLDSMTLFINDQLVDQVNVPQPFDQPGEAAFFVYAFDFADENGYKVFFDNVETYQPVQ